MRTGLAFVCILALGAPCAAQTPLPAVNVDATKLTAKMAGFEERRRLGHGRFITLEQIQKQEHKRFSDIVGQLPGLMVAAAGSASGMYVTSSRGVQSAESPSGKLLALDPNMPSRPRVCFSAVFVDGIPVYSGVEGEEKFDINKLKPDEVAGIEFYAGGASIPTQYNRTSGGTCGTLLVWMR